MKTIAIAVLMLLASANTLPTLTQEELRQERLVTDIIISILEGVSQSIVDAGLDPVKRDLINLEISLSEPEVLSAQLVVEDLYFSGLSNIAINRLDLSILASRLTFDLSLPQLTLALGKAGIEVIFMGRALEGNASGRLVVTQPRIAGDVRFSVGAISGISIRSLNLSFTLGGIESDLNINIQGRELSEIVNTYLNETLPNALEENKKAIDDLLEYVAWKIIEYIL